MTCHKFSKEFISRFVDNELDVDDHNTFIRHKASCPDCCEIETRFRQAEVRFEQQAEAMAGQLVKEMPSIFVKTGDMGYKSIVDKTIKRKPKRTQAILGMLSFAVLAVIIYVASPLNQGQVPAGPSVPGPSAVVNSIDAYGSSIMILETAETHHTIIWFSET